MAERYGGLCPSKSEVRLVQALWAAPSCMDLDTVDPGWGGTQTKFVGGCAGNSRILREGAQIVRCLQNLRSLIS